MDSQVPDQTADAAQGFRPDDAAVVLYDAYLLRRWGRQLRETAAETHAVRQAEARRLLEPFVRLDARVATESGLLLLNDGDLDQAISLLREATQQFRNHPRIIYALMRALREQAERQSRRLDEQARREMIQPWARLRQQDSRLAPLRWLGEGRSWLALLDGGEVAAHATDAFGRLAHWAARREQEVSQAIERAAAAAARFEPQSGEENPEGTESDSVDAAPPRSVRLSEWWAGEVRKYVFGGEAIVRAEDIRDLEGLKRRLRENAAIVNSLEEEYLDCFTLV